MLSLELSLMLLQRQVFADSALGDRLRSSCVVSSFVRVREPLNLHSAGRRHQGFRLDQHRMTRDSPRWQSCGTRNGKGTLGELRGEDLTRAESPWEHQESACGVGISPILECNSLAELPAYLMSYSEPTAQRKIEFVM